MRVLSLSFFIYMKVIAKDSVRFAHYGPSHNLLRPANSGTRILRAPPPARVRGWTRLRNPFHPPGRILPLPSFHLLLHCHPPFSFFIAILTLFLPSLSLPATFKLSRSPVLTIALYESAAGQAPPRNHSSPSF